MLIPSVLEVVKSQLCYVVGTVYMEMPLKPNVLEDIARDVGVATPRMHFDSYQSYSIAALHPATATTFKVPLSRRLCHA